MVWIPIGFVHYLLLSGASARTRVIAPASVHTKIYLDKKLSRFLTVFGANPLWYPSICEKKTPRRHKLTCKSVLDLTMKEHNFCVLSYANRRLVSIIALTLSGSLKVAIP